MCTAAKPSQFFTFIASAAAAAPPALRVNAAATALMESMQPLAAAACSAVSPRASAARSHSMPDGCAISSSRQETWLDTEA
jgi:hypothetical protein